MQFVVVVLIICLKFANAIETKSDLRCNIRTRIDTGWVCGLVREAELGVKYASFRGIPYAQQPLGEFRFQELRPAKPWPHDLDATEEGPACPQHDEVFGRLIKPLNGMSESCIYANVHVPIEAMPDIQEPGYKVLEDVDEDHEKSGYPILVYIHGGGFAYGAGKSDLFGPEYLVSKGIIVITFNYRLNVFGFLSLNTPKIPGNAGLRDQVTLLRWVQRNARAFGGNPHDITLGGQSAGGSCAHLLALSSVTKGLFKRLILMSGTGIEAFYTASPVYASMTAALFLKVLGVNATDPDVIHDQLTKIPIERIVNALGEYQYEAGFTSFSPVVEGKYPGVTRIVEDEPTSLIKQGRDREYPMIVGFASNECDFFQYRLPYLKMLQRIKENPPLILAARIPFSTPPNVALYLANKTIEYYFHKKLNYEEYIKGPCRDIYFAYPAFQLVRWRSEMKAAPSYLYQFSFETDNSAVKKALNMQYKGSVHVDDLTNIFRENAVREHEKTFPPEDRDDHMKDWMTMFVVNFMRCDDPSCGEGWPPVEPKILNYQFVYHPGVYTNRPPTHKEWDMIHFNDKIDEIARNSSIVLYRHEASRFLHEERERRELNANSLNRVESAVNVL